MPKPKGIKSELPHILRNIYRISLALILVASALAITDAKFTTKPDLLSQLKLEIARDPNNPTLHLTFAREAIRMNNYEVARAELELALSLDPKNTDFKKELENVKLSEAQVIKVRGEIGKWEKIVTQYPDFRDGWFILSTLYFQTYQDDKAKEALDTVFLIDPNFTPAKEFLTTINKEVN